MSSYSNLINQILSETDPESRHRTFGDLIRQFQDMAYACAFGILGDFHLAQDATQEAILKAYKKLDHLENPNAFPGWFKQIVISKAHRLQRARKSVEPLDKVFNVGVETPDASESMIIAEQTDLVHNAIKALPEHERIVTSLYYLTQYSQPQIADLLNISLTAVKKRLQRARGRLKQRMLNMAEETLHNQRLSQNEDFATQTLTMIQAAEKGDLSQIALLLQRDPALAKAYNPRPKHLGGGGTVLHHAAWAGQKEAVALLLDYGADINLKAHLGTPISWANEDNQREMVDFLVEKGAEVNVNQAAAFGRLDLLQKLFEENPKTLNQHRHPHATALHAAAYWGQKETAQFLLDKGLDVNTQNPNGGTPLHSAATTLQLPLITLLLDRGAKVNATDKNGHTALHKASKSSYIPDHLAQKYSREAVISHLVDRGANLHAQSRNGLTPLDLAQQADFHQIIPLLQE